MYLEVGTRERIDDPTPQQIGHHLRNLPADAPFLILEVDVESFVQAIPAEGDRFRVEWRQEREHRFMIVAPEVAERAFAAFVRWDETALRSFPWKRMGFWQNPYRWAVALLGIFIVVELLRIGWALVNR